MQWLEKPKDCYICGKWTVFKSAIHSGRWVYAHGGVPRGSTNSLHHALSEAERLDELLINESILITQIWRC